MSAVPTSSFFTFAGQSVDQHVDLHGAGLAARGERGAETVFLSGDGAQSFVGNAPHGRDVQGGHDVAVSIFQDGLELDFLVVAHDERHGVSFRDDGFKTTGDDGPQSQDESWFTRHILLGATESEFLI